MKKVEYPQNIDFEQSYRDIFIDKIGQMQLEWDALRKKYRNEIGYINNSVEEILTARYADLASWYIQFKKLSPSVRDVINKELSKIFDYNKWSQKIADYFKNPKNGFAISSCHYCDMAYINAYMVNPDEDGLYFLNSASLEELSILTKSDSKKQILIDKRQFESKKDFDQVASKLKWSDNKWERTFKPDYKYRHHFDLDHVLPKSVFGLVGLSLYNLVPSCQICNQKLKKTRVLGTNGIPKEKLSPTSPKFDAMRNVEFHVLPKQNTNAGSLSPTQSPEDYDLKLGTIDKDYDDFIKLFKLEERYQFHKHIALHWMEIKNKYSDARINMMAEALNNPQYNFTRIKSDIFQTDLYEGGNMVLMKLREDMLK